MNIYDIAREANVSIATVSRVLNGKPNIHPATAQRVRDVLEKYQYTPSRIARGLATSSMRLVGVVMHDLQNTHYTAAAYVVEQELAAVGYRCLLCNTAPEAMEETLKMLAESRVDGLILIGSIFAQHWTEAALQRYFPEQPVVMINGTLPLPNVTGILCDEADGILQCAAHLWNRAHRRIAYVHDNTTDSAMRKLTGYRQAAARFGFPEQVLTCDTGFAGGIELGRRILALDGRSFDALVFAEDTTALGCIRPLERSGIRIPEDLAVTGYTNTMFAQMASRTLTSIDEQVHVLGSEAVCAFRSRINGNAAEAASITVPVHLVVGETT